MIRKPISGDSEQREREAERARKHSQLSASAVATDDSEPRTAADVPAHGAVEGESAHGAIPRDGIDSDTGGT